jgi:hypothetical protein
MKKGNLSYFRLEDGNKYHYTDQFPGVFKFTRRSLELSFRKTILSLLILGQSSVAE